VARGAKILLVDDEPVVRELVRQVLQVEGNEVVEAPTTNEALDTAERMGPFDVALIDKNLPDGSGIEVARRIKRMQPDTELILITAYPSLDSAIEVLRLGAFDYVIKPFDDINELKLKVQNAAERHALRTAQKNLTRELKESETRYREVVEASPDAILVYDAQGTIRQVNQAACKLYGYSIEDLLGSSAATLIGPDRQDMSISAMATGIVSRIDTHKDGSDLSVEVRSAKATLHGEEMIVEIVRDIRTRLDWADEKAELEGRLRRSQKLEAIGRLAGGVAHDFNNLLVVILNYVDFMRARVDDLAGMTESDQVREICTQLAQWTKDIGEAGDSAAALTRQLLAFSRDQVTAPEALDVNDVVEKVERLLRRTLREDIELKCELSPEAGTVKIDRGQLEQLVMNLAVNARDAMPEGGTLTLSTRSVVLAERDAGPLRLTPGDYAEIAIADTGCGIPDEILEHIYEPFFTTKSDGHGTGIGLATAYQIAHQADGTLQVSTELHEGTVFRVLLPLTDEPTPSEHAELATGEIRGHGETILVVEDDAGVRKLVRRLLHAAGYEVLVAVQGQEGLDTFRQHKDTVDLVLTDVVMPKLKGSMLADQIRSIRPDVKIVFMSGYVGGTGIRASVRDGTATFLAKPFSRRQLLEVIRNVLSS
jgi:PAS domain S-box-containing protein